jgi:preprotein translocase subunit SecD
MVVTPQRRPVTSGWRGALLRCALALTASLLALAPASAEPLPLRITSATAALDQRTREPIIVIVLTELSRRVFGELTRLNVGKRMELRIDGRALTAPVIREPIVGGQLQISGNLSLKETADIAGRLAAGTAKVEVEVLED